MEIQAEEDEDRVGREKNHPALAVSKLHEREEEKRERSRAEKGSWGED